MCQALQTLATSLHLSALNKLPKIDGHLTSVILIQVSITGVDQWIIFDAVTLEHLALNVIVLLGTVTTRKKISCYALLPKVVLLPKVPLVYTKIPSQSSFKPPTSNKLGTRLGLQCINCQSWYLFK